MSFLCLGSRYLAIFLVCASFGYTSAELEIKVNPPEDFEIIDPGYLGFLYLRWQPPVSLENFKQCTVEYELQFRSIDGGRWKTVITKNLYYKYGFDLNKGIEAKIHTLLPKQCTNGSEIRSSWSEATYWMPEQGNVDTKIQDIDCVYYNWQNLFCSWKPGKGIRFDANYYLFYWYDGLNHALQCTDYIKNNGKNVGCKFPQLESSEYKDFYVCVNGSSNSMPIRSSYFILQLQNLVKPIPPDYLDIDVSNVLEVNLQWNVPRGPIPAKCFIYEVELTEDDTPWITTTFDNQLYVIRTSNESHELCFSVRSRVNIYCADDGIWSEWSNEECWRSDTWEETLVFFVIPFILVSFSILMTTCLLLFKQKYLLKMIFRKEKEAFPHRTSLC
ncbi:interleukin-13 receptor subunit alpha-2 isoform X1 [Ochotona princeps]|uniref:interleukin-13 receptor subunit alpha-2 isoform X1 n=1 Tax=Ochotona princeps TaxID=9978 RepID=UPI002714689A|nr:interleukin-13 receptor subunit alpha-2 isoform X1 [Ochotona princeps]